MNYPLQIYQNEERIKYSNISDLNTENVNK